MPTKVTYTGMDVFLYANDPEKSAAWYRDLGFRLVRSHDLPGGLKVFSLAAGKVNLTLGPVAPFEPQATRTWLAQKPWGVGAVLMPQVQDADALHARALEVGAEVVEPPTDQPWGARTVVLRDPDGYWLMFDQPLAARAAKPARKKAARRAAKPARKATATRGGRRARR